MFVDLLKSFIIGICASAPMGPIAILVIQKSLSKGHMAGFVTGLGATVTDTTYATIAVFFLSLAQRFVLAHQVALLIVGGLIVGVIGWFMKRSNPFKRLKPNQAPTYSIKDFFQALAMGISNPGAIIVIFGLFAFFGLSRGPEGAGSNFWAYVLAVCAGSVTYWACMSGVVAYFRKKVRVETILKFNRLTGMVVMAIGIVLFVRGLWQVALILC